jgi:hypothetical protein
MFEDAMNCAFAQEALNYFFQGKALTADAEFAWAESPEFSLRAVAPLLHFAVSGIRIARSDVDHATHRAAVPSRSNMHFGRKY